MSDEVNRKVGEGGDQNPFLEKRDPRAKLLALLLLAPAIMAAPFFSKEWSLAAAFSLGALWGAAPMWSQLGGVLYRLRWLFLTLILLHGFFTPGHPLFTFLAWPTGEGLMAGVVQSLRLTLLVMLSWVLVRTTPAWQLIAAFSALLGGVEKIGIPLGRWLGILAFTLERIPRLLAETGSVRDALQLRVASQSEKGPLANRLDRLALGGEALLFRVLGDVRDQEQALRVRGFGDSLPTPPRYGGQWQGMDTLILSAPVGVWLISLLG
ncbi:MAG: energy-coupling factor transporter transmembrane protein EcfT [Magnetococcales bacterium]|nr:energy-coupling factor transporter transmembrane protein EcfT [Magnetococcales bacterium]